MKKKAKSRTFKKSAVLFAMMLLCAIFSSVAINGDIIITPEDPLDPGGEIVSIHSGSCGDNITWELNSVELNGVALSGSLTISGSGRMNNYNHDAPWNNTSQNVNITSVVISDGITSVGDCAFYNCENLETVVLGEDIKGIGDYAFYGCSALKAIELPAGLTEIGTSAFDCCRGLASVVMPQKLDRLNNYAFARSGITEIVIPGGLDKINNYAFYSCTSLKSVTIPAGVTNIGEDAFNFCTALESVTFLGDAPTYIYSFPFSPFSPPTFYYYSGARGWTSPTWKSQSNYSFDAVCLGRYTRRGFIADGDGVRYYTDGRYLTGWQVIGGEHYYFLKASGIMVTGERSVGGVVCVFGADGRFTGRTLHPGGWRYYPDGMPSESDYARGWTETDGKWYYFVKSNSGYAAVGDKSIGGVVYNFDTNGVFTGRMKNGLLNEDGGIRCYKFNVRQTGWQLIDERRYYFYQSSGLAVTANRFIGGEYCCFDENGVYREPRNGFITEGGVTRYYKNDSYVTGWREIEGNRYYFYVRDGAMVTESRVIGGTWYEISPDGRIAK